MVSPDITLRGSLGSKQQLTNFENDQVHLCVAGELDEEMGVLQVGLAHENGSE